MVTKTIQNKVAECLDCGKDIALKAKIKIGRRVTCPNCEADLEVVEVVPLVLDWYYGESEENQGEW